MKRKIIDRKQVIDYYLKNKNQNKTKAQIADELGIKRTTFNTIILKELQSEEKLDTNHEKIIELLIIKHPYTLTLNKIYNISGLTIHKSIQCFKKSKNPLLQNYYNNILLPKKYHTGSNVTDEKIKLILEGTYKGIGNDLMGEILNLDGATVRRIRKKYLPKGDYEKYHSIEKFLNPGINGFYDNNNVYLSSLEKLVGNYLESKNINFESNVRINFKQKNYCPDFLLIDSNCFIEVFGMSNKEIYIPRMKTKIEFYQTNNIKCLFLLAEDFYINNKLQSENYKNKIDIFLQEIKDKKYNKDIKNIFLKGIKITTDLN